MAWLIWLGGAVALGLVELLTLDLIFLMLSAGALAGAAAAGLQVPWWAQVLVFCVVSVLMLAVVRPWALAHLHTRGQPPAVTGAAAVIGKRGETLTGVTGEGGRVKVHGEVWTARTPEGDPPLVAGATIVVTALDGATAVVRAA
jgi:membrane protein implicated in regulation of membrane protease activity